MWLLKKVMMILFYLVAKLVRGKGEDSKVARELEGSTLECLELANNLPKTGVAPWCYEWIGYRIGCITGWSEVRASYGANNTSNVAPS